MEKREWISQEVENTLSSLEGLKKAQAPAFLMTRIEASLKREEITIWQGVALFFARPIVTCLTVVTILFINTMAYYKDDNTPLAQEEEHVFVNEYSMANVAPADESLITLNEDQ